jgi:hypothetical protein
LQGHYGRTAMYLIENGLCERKVNDNKWMQIL